MPRIKAVQHVDKRRTELSLLSADGSRQNGQRTLERESSDLSHVSVHPRHGNPLGHSLHVLNRVLQLPDRLINVVIHDLNVKVVPVMMLQ